jgi:hypothetical protein
VLKASGGDATKSNETVYAVIQMAWQGQSIGKVKTEIKTDILVEFISP